MGEMGDEPMVGGYVRASRVGAAVACCEVVPAASVSASAPIASSRK